MATKEVALLARDSQNQQVEKLRNGLFLGIATVLLVTVFLFWNTRRLQAKNREMSRQRVLLKTAGEQLADSNKTLEIWVAVRTAQLVAANRELTRRGTQII